MKPTIVIKHTPTPIIDCETMEDMKLYNRVMGDIRDGGPTGTHAIIYIHRLNGHFSDDSMIALKRVAGLTGRINSTCLCVMKQGDATYILLLDVGLDFRFGGTYPLIVPAGLVLEALEPVIGHSSEDVYI